MDFRTKTINQIRLWAWLAAVLPITALAGIFFAWKFFNGTVIGTILTIGETVMFAVAVVWWWWAMFTMRNLVKHWDETKDNVREVLRDVKDMRSLVAEVLKQDDK
jgi:protein-S-isoprenylcysteine O-methyltransferase Ste14